MAVVDILEDAGVETIAVSGLSGGGWTSTFVAAADPRIDITRSIAGSMPFEFERLGPEFLREAVNLTSLRGDFEQSDPTFWGEIATYWDIYALAGGPGRRVELLYFQHDNCCFPATLVPVLNDAFEVLGVDATAFADAQTNTHSLSPSAIEWIVRDLGTDGSS